MLNIQNVKEYMCMLKDYYRFSEKLDLFYVLQYTIIKIFTAEEVFYGIYHIQI